MAYTTNYGYGYTTGMRHTTTKTTSAHIPHIIWNSNSDSRAEWQLTARPHESPKYASMTSTKQYEWPKGEDRTKDEPFCQCCPTFKWFIHIFIYKSFWILSAYEEEPRISWLGWKYDTLRDKVEFPSWDLQKFEDILDPVLNHNNEMIFMRNYCHYSQIELPETYQCFA